jgi:hypothetical protein
LVAAPFIPLPPTPPPVAVIVEKTESLPLVPAETPPAEPPAPTVTVYEVPAPKLSNDSSAPLPPVPVVVQRIPPPPPAPPRLTPGDVIPPPPPPPTTRYSTVIAPKAETVRVPVEVKVRTLYNTLPTCTYDSVPPDNKFALLFAATY